jgi:hypothetical protein
MSHRYRLALFLRDSDAQNKEESDLLMSHEKQCFAKIFK